MPKERQPFDSGLSRVAKFEIPAGDADKSREEAPAKDTRERALVERVKLLWDTYQDIKTGWVAFAHEKIHGRKSEEPLPIINLLDPDNPLSKEFHATPKFQQLHRRLRELWADVQTRAAWSDEMQKHAEQWADVNGNWETYKTVAKEIKDIESRLDDLRKEQFDERGKTPRARRRTLKDDLVDCEIGLEQARARERALSERDPVLAARILAAELDKRHREFISKDGFMWFASRRAIREQLEKMIAERNTLRMIVIEGEAGTGKTTMAKMLARHFTGQDPLSVEVGEKTKVDRALFADETLDALSPTVYRPVLYGLTGKRKPGDEPEHQGRAVFIDELNKLSNDEGGIIATALDRMRVNEPTGYHLFGADSDDVAQTNALVIAAQNPAGGRFRGRTDFTPEVKRKMEIIQIEYLIQTPEDPELHEAFLVALKDADGLIAAKKEELGPDWSDPVLSPDGTFKQAHLKEETKDGGALWRMAQMLHQTYENLLKRKNILIEANPDAWIQGRVLPFGDVFQWLREYQTEVKHGVSLQDFFALKIQSWLESSFRSAGDIEDKRLYGGIAKQFGFLKNKAAAGQPPVYTPFFNNEKITPDLLTDREIAELSPRVPRLKEFIGVLPAAEYTRGIMDITMPDGSERRISFRYEPHQGGSKIKLYRGERFLSIGIVRECEDEPERVGHEYCKKLEDLPETGDTFEYDKAEARRLGLERLEIKGNAAAQQLIEQVISKTINIETPAGKTKFVREWQRDCPDIPIPCVLKDDQGAIVSDLAQANLEKSNFWYLTQLSNNKIVRNLNGDPVPQAPQYDQDQILLVDNWTGTDWDAADAKQKHKSSLLKELLGKESTVNIKRQDLDTALWQGDPTDRIPTEKHKEILEKLGLSPDQFELRCIRQDEYARLAQQKNWGQKNLWTNFDHYFLGDVGRRRGLDGGYRGVGGASRVDTYWRGSADGYLSVRLVLSRNKK